MILEFFAFIAGFKISINISKSLPFKLFMVNTNISRINTIRPGDFIQFVNKNSKYYRGVQITKQVLAMSGDIMEIEIFTKTKDNVQGLIKHNDRILEVKDKTALGTKVHINNIRIIPPQHYFVIGHDNNSFDSRYMEFGLISKDEVIGVARPIF